MSQNEKEPAIVKGRWARGEGNSRWGKKYEPRPRAGKEC